MGNIVGAGSLIVILYSLWVIVYRRVFRVTFAAVSVDGGYWPDEDWVPKKTKLDRILWKWAKDTSSFSNFILSLFLFSYLPISGICALAVSVWLSEMPK